MRKSHIIASVLVAMSASNLSAAINFAPLGGFGGTDGFIGYGEAGVPTIPATPADGVRGLAYDASNDTLFLLGRTATGSAPEVFALNGTTGAQISRSTLTGLTEGTFTANKINVAGDGAIYISNPTAISAAAASFKVYRYASALDLVANTRTLAFEGELTAGSRYGDSIDIRGSGANTQLLVGGGSNNNDVVLLTTSDGSTFTPTIFDVGAASDNQRLGVAFATGNAFFAKGSQNLIRVAYTSGATPTATITNTNISANFPSSAGPIEVITGVPSEIGIIDLLATVVGGTPDSVQLYNATNPAAVGLTNRFDVENYPVDVANSTFLGDLDFGRTATNQLRLYALDTNNGVLALAVAVPEPMLMATLAGTALLGRRRRRA